MKTLTAAALNFVADLPSIEGKSIAILGRPGCGKSTLAQLLCLSQPSARFVYVGPVFSDDSYNYPVKFEAHKTLKDSRDLVSEVNEILKSLTEENRSFWSQLCFWRKRRRGHIIVIVDDISVERFSADDFDNLNRALHKLGASLWLISQGSNEFIRRANITFVGRLDPYASSELENLLPAGVLNEVGGANDGALVPTNLKQGEFLAIESFDGGQSISRVVISPQTVS